MLAETIVCGLAVWQAVEIWHHAELTLPGRKRLLRGLSSSWRAIRFVCRLLLCPFCLSPWVSWLLVVAVLFATPLRWLVIGLAATRVAQLGNDLTKGWCSTPRFGEADEIIDLDAGESPAEESPPETAPFPDNTPDATPSCQEPDEHNPTSPTS